MRDILLALVIGGLLPFALKRPYIGALLFAWVSIMNPHKLTWGFANSFPWAQLIAIVTLAGFLLARKERRDFPVTALTVAYILLMVWMSVTAVTALGIPEWVRDRWIFVMKIHVMVLVTMMLIRGRKQIDMMVWVVMGSVAFYGVKGGAFTIVTGGGARVWGPPGGMIEDNNSLAVALLMMLPLMFYLLYTTQRRWLKLGMMGAVALVAFAVLGTQSRGALLALLAIAVVLGVKSKHPALAVLGLAFAVLLVIGFMPDSWTSRMDTIQGFRSDSSAMTRIYTWITLWNLSLDRPLVGAGFGTDTLNVFRRYAPVEAPFDAFTGTVWVSHSIFLQALGEHGFPGLLLYLSLGMLTWGMARRIIKKTTGHPEFGEWAPLLMRMCQVGLVGYASGGAFLSLMHLDLIYYLMAIIVVTDATVRESEKAQLPLKQPAAVAGGPPVPLELKGASGPAASAARS